MGDKNNRPAEDKKSGCGLITAVFGQHRRTKKSTATSSPAETTPDHSKRRHDVAFISQPPRPKNIPPPEFPAPASHTGGRSQMPAAYVSQGRRVPKEALGISGELESMLVDHQNAGRGNLVRASSSNVMLFGNLGNLRQTPPTTTTQTTTANKTTTNKTKAKGRTTTTSTTTSLCRAVSTRMDPETLKAMGNEDYKNGRFAEALALYEAAISIDPNKASYRSNKSAALTALGRILDAVLECREAIRIDPRYHRAHLRLATLYLRLGEAEKARYHYQHAGQEADREDLAKVKTVQSHLMNCTEARRTRDWNTLVKETHLAISSGADSAPQIYALQAEALLRLHRHQEADKALSSGPKFEVDSCTKFLGPIANSNLLVTTAQVHMAIGRFDEAVEAAGRASKLDPNSREATVVSRKARAVAAARARGNELFKAGRWSEACVAYGEGLENDPYNSVLLCNRAACRSKLGQLEKALDDCTAALNLRPSYTKARFRRADCNAKLERWEISIMDYEVLLQEKPDYEEAQQALSEARAQLAKQTPQYRDGAITSDDDSSS